MYQLIPEIKLLRSKKLAGIRIQMSFSNNLTVKLWQTFMPRRKELANTINEDLFSVEIYNNPLFFQNFDPETVFEKWAAAEVHDFAKVPQGMECLTLPEGMYAVFNYRGLPEDAEQTYRYIFQTWLPQSGYILDNRPHFALMGEKYKNNDPSSEEEIWIPVKEKHL